MSNGIAADAEIEPSETKRQYATTSRKSITAPKNAGGHRAPKTPAAVATPLPPRNPSQIGKQWPIRAHKPAIIIHVELWSERRAGRRTANEPFAASSNSVRIPASGPATRATLVAPMLPLPSLRIYAAP